MPPLALLPAPVPGLADTGVSAVGTMLIIAVVALVLGLGALLLSRRR